MTPPDMDLEHAADSTIAKASARILMPIMVAVLLIVLSVCGYLVVKVLDGIYSSVDEVKAGQAQNSAQFNQIDKKVSLMSQRVDQMLIRQVDQNSEAIELHEKRLERLERVVPVP